MRHLLRVSIMAAGLVALGMPVSSMAQPGYRGPPPPYHRPYHRRHRVPYHRPPPPRHDYGPR